MSLDSKIVKFYAQKKNTDLPLKAIPGHFITNHSHINYFMELTSTKTVYREAKVAADVLSRKYKNQIPVDTILCMDGTEVIGTLLAEKLADSHLGRGTHAKKDVAIVTPEQNANTSQLIFRDNYKPLIQNRDCIVLMASITTGYTVHKAIETIQFYGGVPRGVSSIFSNINQMDGVAIDSIFDVSVLPDYRSYDYTNCPYCKQGIKVDALVNRNGYSTL
ncbi:MAG: orotate phosphoribosyltransferase [Candidatus Onthomonas sp.]